MARSLDDHARDGSTTAPDHVQGACRVGRLVCRLESHPLPSRGAHDCLRAHCADAPCRLRTAYDADGVLIEARDAATGTRAFLDPARDCRGLHGSTHALLCDPATPLS